jgi:predicted lipoprotein with Yx(FWY)xxD motif
MSKLLRILALAGVLLLLLAACGDGTEDEPTEEETPTEEEPAAEPVVEVASSDFGDILVGANGMTLYMFDPDEGGDSTCYDECEENWPPLVLEDGEPAGAEGVDAALLGTTERDDGSIQVTYNNWPLYFWANDEAPGDTTGQAVGDVWWVIGPDGEPIREAPEAAVNSRSDY